MCVCVFVVMSPPVTGLKPQQSGCRARTQPLNKQRVAAASRPLSTRKRVVQVVAKAQPSEGNIRKTVNKIASAGLAALVASAPISSAAIASEFDVLEAPVPETSKLDNNIILCIIVVFLILTHKHPTLTVPLLSICSFCFCFCFCFW